MIKSHAFLLEPDRWFKAGFWVRQIMKICSLFYIWLNFDITFFIFTVYIQLLEELLINLLILNFNEFLGGFTQSLLTKSRN